MSQIQAAGGQPQKQPKYAPIYTGRFFNGLHTNRSPLRAASASHIYEKYYSDNSGDALIAGSNIEVSNRLTLIRRPGNPIYDTSHVAGYNAPDAFDEFRVNKAASDVFGTTLESIFTMVDETTTSSYRGYLYSLTSGLQRGGDSGYNTGLKFQKGVGSGQAFMQAVGNSLYFADGVENKKWLQSLFTRTSAGNDTFLQGSDGEAGTYPFGTYLLDPATGNVQQFIGISIGSAAGTVSIANNVLTITVTFNSYTTAQQPAGLSFPLDSTFQLWGFNQATFLNGATIFLSAATSVETATVTFTAPFNHADYTVTESGPAYVIQTGTTGQATLTDSLSSAGAPVVAETGASVPTYGTTIPSAANEFLGSLTEDGNTIWLNRGSNVENWGIKAPTRAPTFTVAGSELAWAANTYYSPASIYQDTNGYLWQISTAGTTGTTAPIHSSPTTQQKVVISSVAVASNVVTFITDTQLPALSAGDTVEIENLCVATFLNGKSLTVSSTGLSTTGFRAAFTYTGAYAAAADYGVAVKTNGTNPPTTFPDGTAVWTCIQTPAQSAWSAHKHYNVGDFIIVPVGGASQVFQLGPKTQPWVNGTITLDYFNPQPHNFQGSVSVWNSADIPVHTGFIWGVSPYNSPATLTLDSLYFAGNDSMLTYMINGAGEATGTSAMGSLSTDWEGAITGNIFIPVAGQYTFTLSHDDGAFFSFDTTTGATLVTGTNNPPSGAPQDKHNLTAKMGYPGAGNLGVVGNDNSGTWSNASPFGRTPNGSGDSATWNFPTAGNYAFEIDYTNWEHTGFMSLTCPGPAYNQFMAVGRDESGTNAPIWPAFTKSGASYDSTTNQIIWGGSVVEIAMAGQQYTWNNIGPLADFLWQKNTAYTLPGSNIIDTNSNQETAYETGVSGKTQPNPWSSTVGSLTADTNPPLTWINEGAVPALTNTGNTITATSTQGWLYWIALVNTLDNTVSNVGPVSVGTGPVIKGQVTFAPGAGLPTNLSNIDPQADYVAIFRSTDGLTTPLLIPGFVNSPYTVPLAQYLRYGYVDTVPDAELNNLVEGAQQQENTPPAIGAVNLTYHLNRIWYSLGNTVYWTTGPLSPVGNGTDGTAPGNYSSCPSKVTRLVPTAIGMLVYTVSDIFIIPGNGTTSNPILPALPYLTGVGLGSYNALDINGGIIGFFTTDNQFVMFDPSAGLNYVGFNIGDQFRLNNGTPGQSWVSSDVYVAFNIFGEDQAWYVADGANGWFRLIATPAPEQGSVAWSPFATLQGTCGAIKSIETSPGIHNLLVGQTTESSNILFRNLSATSDNGTTGNNGTKYLAYGVIGSIVLAQPGQIAKIAYITTVSVRTGTPMVLGVILDEALPYFTGSFDILKKAVSDPPNLPQGKSWYRQRFYLAEDTETSAYCMDLQIMFQWPEENAMNELQTYTIFGAFEIEQ
jgi:hypothetical protein